jgi:hypothetical protein
VHLCSFRCPNVDHDESATRRGGHDSVQGRRPEPADVQNAGEAPVADEHVSRHQVSVGYLDIEDLLHIVELEDLGPVCDLGLLDSATARARSSAFGEDAYPSLEAKAAALLDSIVGYHALVDGSSRRLDDPSRESPDVTGSVLVRLGPLRPSKTRRWLRPRYTCGPDRPRDHEGEPP